jgi:hypothetical protein
MSEYLLASCVITITVHDSSLTTVIEIAARARPAIIPAAIKEAPFSYHLSLRTTVLPMASTRYLALFMLICYA